MQRIPITPEGFQKLREEFERLMKVERPGIIKAIAEARSHGDLTENAEYHAAKERQSFIEGRIRELEAKLALAEVIDPSKINQTKAAFGAKVRVLDTGADAEYVFILVGPDEADVRNGRISINSPVGRSLLGKEVGDTVVIKAPARTMEYEILEISFE
ncbi:MAG: transcription elongation factor GreA [Thermodesulfovibrionales bacterium]|nr:transcription elongation factor GreA [Thermodesulfovibrionales bacterium]